MEYKWKAGARIPSKLDPQLVGQTLEKLERKHGQLRPEQVVDAARRANNPLHGAFQWDDTRAAEQWRLWQARHLMGAVVAVQIIKAEDPADDRILSVRAFVNVHSGKERYYTGIVGALTDDALRSQVLRRALLDLQAIRRKYSDLDFLAKVYAAIDEATSSIEEEAEEEALAVTE